MGTFGALNKWASGIGGIFFLLNAGNLCQNCNQAMANWGWGQYTCNTVESSLLVTQSLIGMQSTVVLIMVATTTTNKPDLLNMSQLTINGHSLPISIYVVHATIYGSF